MKVLKNNESKKVNWELHAKAALITGFDLAKKILEILKEKYASIKGIYPDWLAHAPIDKISDKDMRCVITLYQACLAYLAREEKVSQSDFEIFKTVIFKIIDEKNHRFNFSGLLSGMLEKTFPQFYKTRNILNLPFVVSPYHEDCKKILEKCRLIVKKGHTWGPHAFFDQKGFHSVPGFEKQFVICKKGIHDVRQLKILDIEKNKSINSFEKRLFKINKYSLGNCDEFSDLALALCLQENIRAEKYFIANGDHVFLVVGRESDSDPSNPNTWGEDAMVIDPWDNCCYSASGLDSYLKKMVHNYQISSEISTDYLLFFRTFNNLKISFHEKYAHLLLELDAEMKTLIHKLKQLPESQQEKVQKQIDIVRAEFLSRDSKKIFEKAICQKSEVMGVDEYGLTRENLYYQLKELHTQLEYWQKINLKPFVQLSYEIRQIASPPLLQARR